MAYDDQVCRGRVWFPFFLRKNDDQEKSINFLYMHVMIKTKIKKLYFALINMVILCARSKELV
jgi:hypothetical protein